MTGSSILASDVPLQAPESLLQVGSIVAAGAVGILSIMALLLWQVNRYERGLMWLGLSGFGWIGAALTTKNFGLEWYDFQSWNGLAFYCFSHFSALMVLSFLIEFLRLEPKRLLLRGLFAAFLFIVAMTVLSRNANPFPIISIVIVQLEILGIILLIAVSRSRLERTDYLPIGLMLLACMPLITNDLLRAGTGGEWRGLGFQTQSFQSLLIFIGCLLVFGRRYSRALDAAREANRSLTAGIDTARSELAESEATRRQLEIAVALESERERLMREMHDGIGSNLVTALAIARRSKESPRATEALRRAILDLKITVDSLAPVDGDVVAFLANFRHRLAPDLDEAGLICEWEVEPCPPLPWLDAQNALHMLRIMQEAIGNVLAHSGADVVTIRCQPELLAGNRGVRIAVIDNGSGFDHGPIGCGGRGIENMKSRAHSLGGEISFGSVPGRGTSMSLWLPQSR